MDGIARFLVLRSRVVLVATAVVSLVAVSMFTRIGFDADVSSFLLEGHETGETFAALQEKYGAGDPINVVASLPEGENFRSGENLALLAELTDALEDADGVSSVGSLLPDTNPVTGEELTADILRHLPDSVAGTLIDRNPVADLLLSEDARHTLVVVGPGTDATGTALAVGEVTLSGVELTFSGNPVVFAAAIDAISVFLLIIPPLVIVLLVGVFAVTIGSRRLAAMAIVPAVLGSLWTFGLVFALGVQIDIVTVVVPIFVIVMGSADGLHFVTHFNAEAVRTSDPVERVASALRHVGVPMILTTVSTAAGFASLAFTDVEPIRQLGLFSAAGIIFAGIISFFSLPAAISHLGLAESRASSRLGAPLVRGLGALARHRTPAVVLTVAIILFAAVAIPRLGVNSDQLFFFSADDPVREAFERTEELFGGATPLTGEMRFDPDDPEGSLTAARGASDRLESLPGVRRVFSVADVASRLPPDQLQAVLSGEANLPTGRMVSEDGLRFVLLPADFDSSDVDRWLEVAEEEPAIQVLTGMPVVWNEIARLVLDAQVTSLGVAYLLVTGLLALAYRRLRETLISLVPISLTIATLLGFLAVSGIQLNLITAVVSSIVIGVGIDYVIHFIAAIGHARAEGADPVMRALTRAGPPIVANALGIAVGLSALWLSPLAMHHQLSLIMWVAMVTAALTSLLVVPALLPRADVGSTPPLTSLAGDSGS
jgi:uncharacterized protein